MFSTVSCRILKIFYFHFAKLLYFLPFLCIFGIFLHKYAPSADGTYRLNIYFFRFFCLATGNRHIWRFRQFKHRLAGENAIGETNHTVTLDTNIYRFAEVEVSELNAGGVLNLNIGEEHLTAGKHISRL